MPVASLVPEELQEASVDDYMQNLPNFDEDMAARAQAAADKVGPFHATAVYTVHSTVAESLFTYSCRVKGFATSGPSTVKPKMAKWSFGHSLQITLSASLQAQTTLSPSVQSGIMNNL